MLPHGSSLRRQPRVHPLVESMDSVGIHKSLIPLRFRGPFTGNLGVARPAAWNRRDPPAGTRAAQGRPQAGRFPAAAPFATDHCPRGHGLGAIAAGMAEKRDERGCVVGGRDRAPIGQLWGAPLLERACAPREPAPIKPRGPGWRDFVLRLEAFGRCPGRLAGALAA